MASNSVARNGLAFVALLLAASSLYCASAWDTRPISEKYREQLQQLEVGMPLTEFQRILPEASPRGQTTVAGTRVDAYELIWRHTYYRMGDRHTELLWFYFADKTLVRWGAPNDWPTPADLTVELRNR